MSNIRTVDNPVRVRVLAEYQLFSDLDAQDWWLTPANEVINGESNVADATLLYIAMGPFGLQHVFFLAEFYVPAGNTKFVEKHCRKILNKFVSDSDVIVHNIVPVQA